MVHAALAVLSSETLWDAITACMDGYPRALSLFYREHTSAHGPDDHKSSCSSNIAYLQLLHRDDSLVRDGVLPHLAVVTGNANVLRLVYKFNRQQKRQPLDPKLSLARVMYCAVLFQRIDMLKCIAVLQAHDSAWACEPNLMACALRRPADANVSVLEWLYCHLPPELRVLEPSILCTYARTKRVDVMQWLHEHGCPVSQRTVDGAVHGRHAPMLTYLCAHTSSRCSRSTFEDAASNGYLDLVKVIVETHEADTARHQGAARSQLMVDTAVSDIADAPQPLDDLFTSRAMDVAARNGHLDVLTYLDTHGVSACTVRAMDDAAANGHLDVVTFLHRHRTEGCTTNAMDSAAARGHLDVLTFLHANRSEGCTPNALMLAIRNRHKSVMRFLCAHRLECDVVSALTNAAAAGDMDDVELLHASLRTGESAYAAVKAAARNGRTKVVAYLCAHQAHEQTRLLHHAIADDRAEWVVQAVCAFAPMAEVLEAKERVDPLQRPRVIAMLERRIRTLRSSAAAAGRS